MKNKDNEYKSVAAMMCGKKLTPQQMCDVKKFNKEHDQAAVKKNDTKVQK